MAQSCFEDLKHLFAAKTKCIWIKTHEEVSAIEQLKAYILKNQLGFTVTSWSSFYGQKEEQLVSNDEATKNDRRVSIEKFFDKIDEAQNNSEAQQCLWIIKDFHIINENKNILRGLRDIKEKNSKEMKSYQPIIVVSPVLNIPIEHEKLFSVLELESPNREEISKTIRAFVKKISNAPADRGYEIPTSEIIDECINLSLGLTKTEITSYLARSLSKYKTLNPDIFYEARVNLINKTGLLELMNAKITMDDMGGNHVFKDWISDVKLSLNPEAEIFGVEKSKGYVGIGIPGTSKTLSAEMIAKELGLPLLKFNISKVMSSFVGKSEQNMEKALEVVQACAPCVLLIDEVEKTMSGMQSSARTDGGTMARVIGSMLQFLSSENSKDVFTVMTSNDISQMPPELTRSGRLDTVWYFGLPTEEERKEIWRIHFGKTPIKVSEEILSFASANSENLTGAEIKEAVKVSMRKAYKRFITDGNKTITADDVKTAISEIVPVFNASKEKIVALEKYAETRARFASIIVEKESAKKRTIPTIKMSDLAKK